MKTKKKPSAWWLALLLAPALAAAAPAAASKDDRALPVRNLIVELRWVDLPNRGASAEALRSGGYVVGTAGSADARGSVVTRSRAAAQPDAAPMRIRVLNGHAGRMAWTQRVPLRWVEVANGPRGSGGVLRQAWVAAGRSIEVTPRWPGGHAPVTVELRIDEAVAPNGSDQDGGHAQGESTTLAVPLDEWAPVAESAAPVRTSDPDTVSSTDAARLAGRRLEVRVSSD